MFTDNEQYLTADSILIAHSLGGAFALRILEHIAETIVATFLVAPAIGVPPCTFLEGDLPFVGHAFGWDKIKRSSGRFVVYHSEDDPLVGFGNGQKATQMLGVDLIRYSNAGHCNTAAGYVESARVPLFVF